MPELDLISINNSKYILKDHHIKNITTLFVLSVTIKHNIDAVSKDDCIAILNSSKESVSIIIEFMQYIGEMISHFDGTQHQNIVNGMSMMGLLISQLASLAINAEEEMQVVEKLINIGNDTKEEMRVE